MLPESFRMITYQAFLRHQQDRTIQDMEAINELIPLCSYNALKRLQTFTALASA